MLLRSVHMAFKTSVFLLSIVLVPGAGRAQSVIRTILGGLPDGVDALSATLNTPAAVATDNAGNIYVGLTGSHVVVKIDKSGRVKLVAGNGTQGSSGDGGPATAAMLSSPVGLAVDAAGNLYIADSLANRVRCVNPAGTINTCAGNGKAVYSGDGGQASLSGLHTPTALAIDLKGNILIADSGNHAIRSIAPNGTISSFMGTGVQGACDDGTLAVNCKLNAPAGVTVDASGNIFVADTGNGWVRIVTPDGTTKLYAGKNNNATALPFGGGDPNLATNTVLFSPTNLATDRTGNVYIVQYASARVLRVTTDGKIASFAGTGTAGATGDGGLARFANIDVQGIAIDSQSNLLIADGESKRVRIVTAADGIINTIAGNGIGSYDPRGLAFDGTSLYFSDGAANRVRRINISTGEIINVAGNGAAGDSGDGGPAINATLKTPRGLTVDASGNLYIADSGNNWVRKVGKDGNINVIAGTGAAVTRGDGGSATTAGLDEPYAVSVDGSSNLYIVERSGNVVRKVTSGGVISTIAGTGNAGGPTSETGVALSQMLNVPTDIAVLSSGSILIADSNNNRIRRLTSDGTIATIAGTGYYGFGGDGGPAAAAYLRKAAGMAMDSTGNLYLADTSNQRIRRIDPTGVISSIAGNGVAGYTGDGSPATAWEMNGPTFLAAGPNCSLFIADSENGRIRQLFPAVDYTITTAPAGLTVTLDGGAAATAPVAASLLPGTHHTVNAPATQNGPSGTRYLAPAAQGFDVACGPARAAITVTFRTQYALSIASDHGGTVTSAAQWQDAGAAVTLQATPASGYVFSGWEGDCTGTGPCSVTMNGPKSVKADFAPASVLTPAISAGGVAGAGLSVPAVQAVSPNGIAIVYGSSFAPSGTLSVASAANLVNGRVSTELDGVCVLVGGVRAPVLAVTPTQVNFQVPASVASGNVSVQVATACGSANEQRSDPAAVTAQSASPEFFSFVQNASGQNPVAAVDVSTGTYVGVPNLLAGANFAPAKPGDVLTLYGTGFGITNPAVATGELPAASSGVAGSLQVTVGGVALGKTDLLYAGVAPGNAGLYQINLHLPASTPDGNLPVQVTVNGFTSPAGAYITVQH